MIKCSFDFDETLDRLAIQQYANELIQRNIEVYIVTARHDDDSYAEEMFRRGRVYSYNINDDLFEIANNLNIPKERIIFMCGRNKYHFFKESDFLWHLDNDYDELQGIERFTNVIPIDSLDEDWRKNCEFFLKQK